MNKKQLKEKMSALGKQSAQSPKRDKAYYARLSAEGNEKRWAKKRAKKG